MHILFLLVEIILLASGFFLNFYSHHRMGLSRHFQFEQFRFEKWAENFPMEWLLALVLIIMLAIVIIVCLKRRAHMNVWAYIHACLLVVLVFLTAFCISPWRETLMIYPYLVFALPLLMVGNAWGLIHASRPKSKTKAKA